MRLARDALFVIVLKHHKRLQELPLFSIFAKRMAYFILGGVNYYWCLNISVKSQSIIDEKINFLLL